MVLMVLPQIKKSVQKFLMEETGTISKQSLLKIGGLIALAPLVSPGVFAGGCDSGGEHCSAGYEQESSPADWSHGDYNLTGDMKIIIEGGGGNLIHDADTHMNETQDTSSGHAFLAVDECRTAWSYVDASHENCWISGFGSHGWVYSCVHYNFETYNEHWNAAHHVNDIGLSSEDFLNIVAKHSNYVAVVDRDIYAFDICGPQHSSDSGDEG